VVFIQRFDIKAASGLIGGESVLSVEWNSPRRPPSYDPYDPYTVRDMPNDVLMFIASLPAAGSHLMVQGATPGKVTSTAEFTVNASLL
jgi:hypothetical protein